MKITYLCEYGSVNGAEKSLLAMLRLLPETDYQPRVVAPGTGPFAAELDRLGVPRLSWPDRFADSTLEEKRRHLERLLRDFPTDLVHANSLSMGRLGGPVVQSLGITSVAHIRDIIRLNRTVIDDLNRHHRLFAVSDATRGFHIAQGLDAVKCLTLYNGVNLREFCPKSPPGRLHRELQIPYSARLLGCIGQIGPRKGQDVLLDAVEPILEPLDLHLLVVGERFSGKEETIRFEKIIRNRISKPPFADRVHLLGIRNDTAELLPDLTLLVHPARQEPLGRVLLESLACGVTAIATDVGGTTEILPRKEQLVSPDEPEGLRQKIVDLLENDALRREIGLESRRIAEAKFDDAIAMESLRRHYDALIGK